jgi:hypothetical protein
MFRIKLQAVTGTDNIILKNVEGFTIQASEGFKDKKLIKNSNTSF